MNMCVNNLIILQGNISMSTCYLFDLSTCACYMIRQFMLPTLYMHFLKKNVFYFTQKLLNYGRSKYNILQNSNLWNPISDNMSKIQLNNSCMRHITYICRKYNTKLSCTIQLYRKLWRDFVPIDTSSHVILLRWNSNAFHSIFI